MSAHPLARSTLGTPAVPPGRTRRRRGSIAVTLLGAAIVALAPAPPANAATVDATYQVWTWNVAGWAIHGGSTTDGLIPVCHNQYDAIRRNLRNSGWMQDPDNFARFTTTRSGRCNGEDVTCVPGWRTTTPRVTQ